MAVVLVKVVAVIEMVVMIATMAMVVYSHLWCQLLTSYDGSDNARVGSNNCAFGGPSEGSSVGSLSRGDGVVDAVIVSVV